MDEKQMTPAEKQIRRLEALRQKKDDDVQVAQSPAPTGRTKADRTKSGPTQTTRAKADRTQTTRVKAERTKTGAAKVSPSAAANGKAGRAPSVRRTKTAVAGRPRRAG